MRPILLDTHIAIWSADGSVGKAAAAKIKDAARSSQLMLSPISAWEIGMLVERRRLNLAVPTADYVQRLFSGRGVTTAVLTPEIALAAASLSSSFPRDPADRIIVASALAYDADLFTRDREILRFAKGRSALRAFRV